MSSFYVCFESYGHGFDRVIPKGRPFGVVLHPILTELAIRLSAAFASSFDVLLRAEGCIAESDIGRQIRWQQISDAEFCVKFYTYDEKAAPERWTIPDVTLATSVIRKYFEELKGSGVRTWLELK